MNGSSVERLSTSEARNRDRRRPARKNRPRNPWPAALRPFSARGGDGRDRRAGSSRSGSVGSARDRGLVGGVSEPATRETFLGHHVPSHLRDARTPHSQAAASVPAEPITALII